MAARLGTEPVLHPCSGHDLPLDDPEWTCDQVALWLARTGGEVGDQLP
jgi:hypothetical protein